MAAAVAAPTPLVELACAAGGAEEPRRARAPLAKFRAAARQGRAAGASKIVVALDVDEVLVPYLKAFIVFYNGKRGKNYRLSDFNVYRFWEVTGDSYEDMLDYIDEFHRSDLFRNLEPIPGVQEAISRLASLPSVELHIVTSRTEDVAEETRAWLEKHFPGIFPPERIHIGNHFGRTGSRISKSQICAEIGARLLIDDSLDYCTELAEAGTEALLFDLDGGYAWNGGGSCSAHDLVTRVKSWKGAVDLIAMSLCDPHA